MTNATTRDHTVLVVENLALVRAGLVSTVSQLAGFTVIAEAGSGEEAVTLARSLEPDLVLMDLRMPGIGGLEAAHRISMTVQSARIVAVTASENEPKHRLSRSGFSACVGKSAEPEVFAATLKAVLTGKSLLETPSDNQIREPSAESPFDQLTPRQMQVEMLTLQGQKISHIAEIMHIESTSVYTYRRRLHEKLGIKSDIELADLARLHGVSPV